jgi:hypothetical protein
VAEKARRVEALGYDLLGVADHLTDGLGTVRFDTGKLNMKSAGYGARHCLNSLDEAVGKPSRSRSPGIGGSMHR